MVFIFSVDNTAFVHTSIYGVVERCLEFIAPSVEPEVEQTQFTVAADKGYESVIARPCVVGGT